MAKTHGLSHTAEYNVYRSMMYRCYREATQFYIYYGARGIRVCRRWHKFENFYKDMGPRPSKSHSIDRIDNNKNYSPKNCKWSTAKEQANNTRKNLFFDFGDETLTLAAIATKYKINYGTLYSRIYRSKMSLEKALIFSRNYKIKRRSNDSRR